MIVSLDAVFYTAIFLLPGFLMKLVIDSLSPPKKHSDGMNLLFCLVLSIANCAVWSWLYNIVLPLRISTPTRFWLLFVLITVIGCLILACIIGLIKQKKPFKKIIDSLHINTINTIPTAWDFYFSNQESSHVIVRLSSGDIVYGYYGENSFTSSEIGCHDIYLEKIYIPNDDGVWIEDTQTKGILIVQNMIETIEFLGGSTNEQG